MAEKLRDPEILRKIPIFNSLSDEELMEIINSPDNRIEEYGQKEIIVREAEIADCMYVVLEGSVDISIRGGSSNREITIATLHAGDFFGEQAFATDDTGRRSATVRTYQASKLFRIDKKYIHLGVHHEVSGSEDPTVPADTPEDKEVRKLLKSMRLFQSLDENELATIGSWTEIYECGPGDFVLKESEVGDCLYVVLDGTVEIFILDDDGKIVLLNTCTRGEYFGEQALMPDSSGKRSAYARSDNLVRLIKVPKSYFRLLLNRDALLSEALTKIGNAQKKELDQIQKG